MEYKKLSIIMPAYNEEKSLKGIVEKVVGVDYGIDFELIIINDGSKDNTGKIAEELAEKDNRITVINNEKNLGKSQTVRVGILSSYGDLVVIQDADFEYNPENLIEFVKIFKTSDVDVVYGNRFGRKNSVVYWQNWFGNRGLSFISSLFTGPRAGIWTSDMEVCYKMAKGDLFRELGETVRSKSNFGFEPEITAKFSKYKKDGKHLKFKQIPIEYYPRTIAEGKHMKAFRDGMKALKEILIFNLRK